MSKLMYFRPRAWRNLVALLEHASPTTQITHTAVIAKPVGLERLVKKVCNKMRVTEVNVFTVEIRVYIHSFFIRMKFLRILRLKKPKC